MKRPLTYVLAGLLLTTAVSPLYAIAQDGPPGSQQGGPGGGRGPGDQGGDRGPGNQGGNHGPGNQGGDRGPGDQGGNWGPSDHGGGYHGGDRGDHHRWARGERFQDHYQGRMEVVDDYRDHRLRRPPHGYHWVRDDSDNFLLVAIASGVISDMVLNSH